MMGAHRGRGADAVAAHDRHHHAVVLELRFRQPAEIAELGAAERLHPHPRRQGHLGDIAVLRAGIDRVVKALIDFVKPLRIAGIAQHPQFLMHGFQRLALRRRHSFRGKARAQRFQLRHRLEHAGEPVERRPRHHRAAMRPRIDQAGGRKLAQRLAYRRARDIEALRDLGFVERGTGRQRAAHDFVGELQPQFFGARDLARHGGRAVDAADHLCARDRTRRRTARKIVQTHVF